MTIEEQIASVSGTGTIEVNFQNPRIDLVFRALKENYLLIMDGMPCYVDSAMYNKRKDTVTFDIERVRIDQESSDSMNEPAD